MVTVVVYKDFWDTLPASLQSIPYILFVKLLVNSHKLERETDRKVRYYVCLETVHSVVPAFS